MLDVNSGFYYGELGPGPPLPPDVPFTGAFQKVNSILVDGGDRFGVSAVSFDSHEELIWMGNRGGHVTSYYGTSMEKYTSFQVANQEVRQILTFNELILILSESQLRGQIRRGLPIFTYLSENLINMQCMLQTSHSTVLLGGHQDTLVEYDFGQNIETKQVYIGGGGGTGGCAMLRGVGPSRICAGLTSGQVYLLDSRTYHKEHEIEAHSGSLSDLDVHGNMLVTAGFSERHGGCSVDRFLKVYDLRMIRSLAPIQVSIDPIMLRFLPSFSSIAAISPTGQMEILETQALSSSNIMVYQVTSSECRAFDISSACHHIAFGDEAGTLNLFGNSASMFNPFSRPTEFPDPVEQFPFMSYTEDSISLGAIPLPLASSYSSDWPPQLCTPGYRAHPELDPGLLVSMKMVGPIGYAPNPGNFRRNQMQYKEKTLSSHHGGGHHPHHPHAHHPHTLHVPHSSISGGRGVTFTKHPNRGMFGKTTPQFPPIPKHLRPHVQRLPSSGLGNSSPTPPHHHQIYPKGVHIPKRYSRIELNQMKKAVIEPGDMASFNQTKFPGLEALTVNSYCNPMLQMLYHLEYLRGFCISHLCQREACLSCELGFLFHMLDKSGAVPCSGANFLRAFRVVPEASALGLIRQENQAKHRGVLLRLIQSWNRFILHQIETETGKVDGEEDAVSAMFSMKQDNLNRCTRCGEESKKDSVVLLSNLLYTADSTRNSTRANFIELLTRSLYPEHTTPAWCEKCQKYQPTFQSRAPKTLPIVLSLNTCLDNTHDFGIWKQYLQTLLPKNSPGTNSSTTTSSGPGALKSCRYGSNCVRPDCKFWHEGRSTASYENKQSDFESSDVVVKWIPARIRISIDDGKVSVVDLDELTPAQQIPTLNSDTAADFELIGSVIFAKNEENEDRNNLVSVLRVDPGYFERAGQSPGKGGSWYLFNDFCVQQVPPIEAMTCSPSWKIPCVLYYQRIILPPKFTSFPILPTVTLETFQEESKSKGVGRKKSSTYTPLSLEELPKKGDLVAMDAEFVTLGQEETELRSDGKLSTVKPQQLSLARVSCLRGQGELEGSPFLDDYISTQEVVVDYLTKFSGIQPGDLDAQYSTKHVIGLKSAYLKLRYLIDAGVVFVGHGLSNDFRVMNLVVPPEQVIDTVNLFHLPNQRMVSLRFLAWHFLSQVIQLDTHDSAEDARAALALYRKYEELKAANTLDKALEELYEAGIKYQWKVNGSDK